MLLLLKLIFLINAIHVFEAIPDKPGKCNKSAKGNRIVVKDREGEAKLLICDKNGKIFRWKMIDVGSHEQISTFTFQGNSYGNIFNPAIDCSDIMNNLPEAVTGVYWIKTDKGPREVWCDMETDGGGFMLIGVQNSPVSWDVPSQPKLVHPLASRRWSSLFGNMSIKDFRVQISTSKSFSNTKAHWYYRFNSARKLTQILLFNKGGCSSQYPGIGDIQFIKDLRNKKIVTAQFQCSRFGTHFHKSLGWGKMNDCLGTPCNSGFAFLKLTTTGSFSFSVVSSKSGIRNNSTAFIGCDRGKCCACYGPFSDRDYCGPQCQSINGGTVLSDKNKIYAWFWVRTTLPKRVWKKCMEYEKTDQEGQIIKWHVDKENGVPRKGPCSYPGDVRLNDGVVVVGSNDALQKLPNIEGLLSYRADNGKLYLRGKHLWKTMMNKGETESIIQNMEEDVTAKLQSLEDKLEKIERKLNANSGNGSVVILGNSCKDILSKYKFAISGIYWIKVASVLKPFQVYCDMETHGGGWTLVYSYAFTNYNSFTSLKNAVTPRPNWPTTSNANVPVSTTPPLSESLLGAVDWNLWRNIGQDIMIKSNINDWIVCQPNGGSLVTKKYGSMICQNIKNVANFCSGVAPKKVVWWSAGPSLDTANSQYYYFDGNTRNGWPTHDPCGKNARNYKKGVSSPGGQIYLR